MHLPIEQTLRPETVNELLLIRRIEQLHRLAHQHYVSPWSMGEADKDPNSSEITLSRLQPRLHLASLVESKWADPASLKITARSFGKDDEARIGYAHYVTRDRLEGLQPGEAANMLGHLHGKLIHDLAKHLEERAAKRFAPAYSG